MKTEPPRAATMGREGGGIYRGNVGKAHRARSASVDPLHRCLRFVAVVRRLFLRVLDLSDSGRVEAARDRTGKIL